MFRIDALPDFVFVEEGEREATLRLSEAGPRIRAIAAHIAARVPPNSCIGLLYTSEPNLVLNWLACLAAGMRPLVMQYPTRKQSRDYWLDSVRNTIAVADVKAIVADAHCASLGIEGVDAVVVQSDLDALPDGNRKPITLKDFTIVQLSSGTTGYRKAMEFRASDLRRHVEDYNDTLKLTKADKVVSWLPLYHDMGYIACFVMPMALGVPVVMIDPMVWVRNPELLYRAIERHRGTCCYMPNFGYEVMARLTAGDLSSMRWWIASAETVSPETARKFIAATGIHAERFTPAYAAAENMFAISARRGVETRSIDGVEIVSCGRPIRGVDVKIVEDEIWVRSPASLKSYMDGAGICDADGYYASGDLGRIVDDEIYVIGRKQDLLVQAGRKFMLSDIDLVLNRLFPDVRGRGVAVQVYDERLGTQKPVILIEAVDFFTRTDRDEIAEAVTAATGLDQVEVAFVPPRFLTKTSSGKFNRKKSAQDWLLAGCTGQVVQADPVAQIRSAFPTVAWNLPVSEVLDSLSLTVLQIILSDAKMRYRPEHTLDEIAARLASSEPKTRKTAGTIRIVSIADVRTIRRLTDAHLDKLEAALGAPVTLEHVCLPPSPVILSDAIFNDYFRPRIGGDRFAAVERAFATLRDASFILADDTADMLLGPGLAYGALSHNMERDPRADLVATRWQRYTQFHHELPLTFVSGMDLALDDRSRIQGLLSAYLKKPLFRVAVIEEFAAFTGDWEFRSLHSGGSDVREPFDVDALIAAIAEWAAARDTPLHLSHEPNLSRIEINDLRHYCSVFADKNAIDAALAAFNSFCIVGQHASVPYVRKELERLGKPHFIVPSYAPEILKTVPGEFECLLICGAMGDYPIDKPAVAIMLVNVAWTTRNIDDDALKTKLVNLARYDSPASGTDWFYSFPFDRTRSAEAVMRARVAAKEQGKLLSAARAERQAAREERLKRREVWLARQAHKQARAATSVQRQE